MAYFAAIVAGLCGLLITPEWLFYFDITPKVAAILIGAAVMLFARGHAPRWLVMLVCINVVWLGVCAATSPNAPLALFGTNWRRFGALTQAAVWIFSCGAAAVIGSSKENVRVLLRGITLASSIAAAFGIAQFFGWDPILPKTAYHIGEGTWTIVRPPGTLGYVSYFATWLTIAGFLAMELADIETSRSWRYFAWTTAAITLAAMLLTGTRAAMFGAAAGCALRVLRDARLARRAAAIGAVAAAAGILFYFSPLGWQLRSRSRWYAEDPWGGARLPLWRDTLRMAAARPLTGYGADVYTAEFPAFESRQLARAYPDFAYESPHNIFLDALVSGGLPGCAVLAVFVALGFYAGLRMSNSWMLAALAGGLVSQQFTVFTAPTAMLLFLVAALFAVNYSWKNTMVWRSPRWLSAAGALPLSYVVVRLLWADSALALASRDLDAIAPRRAEQHYALYRRARLPGSSADLWYSRALLNLAQRISDPSQRIDVIARSGAAALEATQTSEDPFNAWYNLALQDATRNDASAAERSLRAAIAAHPNWFKPHWTLAQLLRLTGRLDEGEREALIASDLDSGKHPEVAQTLSQIRKARSLQK